MDKNTLSIISLLIVVVNCLGYVRGTGLILSPLLSGLFCEKIVVKKRKTMRKILVSEIGG